MDACSLPAQRADQHCFCSMAAPVTPSWDPKHAVSAEVDGAAGSIGSHFSGSQPPGPRSPVLGPVASVRHDIICFIALDMAVQVLSQPLVNNDQLTVRMSVPKGWGLVAKPKTLGAIDGAIPASQIQTEVLSDNLRLTDGRFETAFPLTGTTSWVFASL